MKSDSEHLAAPIVLLFFLGIGGFLVAVVRHDWIAFASGACCWMLMLGIIAVAVIAKTIDGKGDK